MSKNALAETDEGPDRSDGETLDPTDARTLLEAVDEYKIGPLDAVLLLTGLRKGQALGLGWSSIDLDSSPATLTVTRSLKRGERDALYLDEPKTSGRAGSCRCKSCHTTTRRPIASTRSTSPRPGPTATTHSSRSAR